MRVNPINTNQQNFTAAKTDILRTVVSPKGTYHLRRLARGKLPGDAIEMLYLTKERRLFGIIPLPDRVVRSKMVFIIDVVDAFKRKLPERLTFTDKEYKVNRDNPRVITARRSYETRTLADIQDDGYIKPEPKKRPEPKLHSVYSPIENSSFWTP